MRQVDGRVEVYAQGAWIAASAITRTPGGLVVVETVYYDGETQIPEVYIVTEAVYDQQPGHALQLSIGQ